MAALAVKAAKAMPRIQQKTGIVVSTGLMEKTVKVRVSKSTWNARVQRRMITHTDHLVHDPTRCAHAGDVVTIEPTPLRTSRLKRHRLSSILAANGPPLAARPAIPSRAAIILARKQSRAASDAKLLQTTDRVIRLHELEQDPGVAAATRANRHKAPHDTLIALGLGALSVAQQRARELAELRTRPDVRGGVIRRAVNGALMRSREALKADWRLRRAEMDVRGAGAVAVALEREARRWFLRGSFWFADGARPVNRGRIAKWRAEMQWRGQLATTVAADLRIRAVECRAYVERVGAVAEALGLKDKVLEAEEKMHRAEEAVVMSMARTLASVRGVYDLEIQSLREEGDWLKSHGHLRGEEWRWKAHQIQLAERGALDAPAIVAALKAKGDKGVVWTRAVTHALAYKPKADVEQMVEPLGVGLRLRQGLLSDAQAVESGILARLKKLKVKIAENGFRWESGQMDEIVKTEREKVDAKRLKVDAERLEAVKREEAKKVRVHKVEPKGDEDESRTDGERS